MAKRKPQINFQVEDPLKLLYDEAKLSGYLVTRLCAAGLLMMVEDPTARERALDRLREWEAEYDEASADEIREFVRGAQAAMQRPARGSRPSQSARPGKKRAKRSRSA